MFDDRFREVFSRVEIELASSLPVIHKDCEVVFFYSTSDHDEFSYSIDSVSYIFSRNIYTGEIKKVEPGEVDADLVSELTGEIIRPEILDEDALDLEDEYYEHYESIYEMILKHEPVDKEVAERLTDCFHQLVPDGKLKELYQSIGGQMFTS